MKRILVHGNKRVKECNECGCIFTYEKEDVVTEQTGINEYMTYVACPDCNYSHELYDVFFWLNLLRESIIDSLFS